MKQLSSALCAACVFSIVALCLVHGFASDARNSLSGLERSAEIEAAVLKGRKHPSYQVFAAQIKLPEIRGGGPGEVIVLAEEAFTIRVNGELSAEQKADLSQSLKLPGQVLVAVLKALPAEAEGPTIAAQFKTAIIDFFFLLERWTAYRPAPGKEEIKAQALKALEEGNIAEAWLEYTRLPKPAPPASSPGALGR